MRLYFLRHGIAEEGSFTLPDDLRALTTEGIAEMRRMASALQRKNLRIEHILTSPLVRARQTADIVADALGLTDALQEDDRLAGGFRLSDVQQMVAECQPTERLMFVGHEPTLRYVATQLIGGGQMNLKKGGLIRLRTDRIEPGAATLDWLLTPDVLG
jgi:phosphohistidine phosphatase